MWHIVNLQINPQQFEAVMRPMQTTEIWTLFMMVNIVLKLEKRRHHGGELTY